jgi:catechol 2,3-dioxygenase-like lactoylglutathione lyase family enzyme
MTIEIDHTGLSVADMAAAKKFYAAALAPLGMAIRLEFPASVTGGVDVCGIGPEGRPFFWLAASGRQTPRFHIAFRAEDRAQVDAFYKAAIAAGGKDNGPPGLRTMYHPTYYGAFVLDPEGHNIEAVCHKPE